MIQLYSLKFSVPNGFRIGSKVEANLVTQLRIDSDIVLIPSSSWKGMFRRVSESVLNNREHSNGHGVSGEGVEDEVVKKVVKKAEDLARVDERFRKIAESNNLITTKRPQEGGIEIQVDDKEKLAELFGEYNCPIERLYGGKYFAGGITVSDTVIKSPEIEQRIHVSIDRKSRKGIERHLYQEEIVHVNFVEVKVIVRGEFELWKNTLKFLRDIGYFIGGGKSRGIGYIKLNDKESMYAEVKGLGERPKFDSLSKYLS